MAAAMMATSSSLLTCSILGGVALVAQRPIVVKLYRGRSVGPYVRTCVRPSVGRSVCPVHCGKMADQIRLPFGIVGRTGPGMRQVAVFGDPSTGRGTFGANFGRCATAPRRGPLTKLLWADLLIVVLGHTEK